jgi:hypothetical protein
MALKLTQSLTEMSTRNFPGVKARPARKADSLTDIFEPIICKIVIIDVSQPYGIPRHITGIELRGLSPRANYTDRATAACRRS